MRSTKAVRTGYIIMSLVFCALGAVLFCAPAVSARWIGVLLGIGMTAFGAVKLLGFFSRELFGWLFPYDLAFGIPVLADGLFKLQLAGEAKTLGVRSWIGLGVLAILTCAAGVLLIIHPWAGARTIVMVMGVSLFMDGVLNLAAALSAAHIARAKRPDSVDVRYHRVDE